MQNILLAFAACFIAISSSAGVITCQEENTAVFVQINQDFTGYVNTEDMCILLTCSNNEYGITCTGFDNNYGYSVYIHEQYTAVVSRTNGLNYDTLSVLSCTATPGA